MDSGGVPVIIRARDEQGWTLIELLVAMTLMIVVLSATLTSFNAFSNNSSRSMRFNDQQDQIRNVIDQIIRQARNLANPTTGAGTTTTIAWASKDRLVFQTTDPQKQWVSYCLDTTTASREKIWYQTTSSSLAASNVAGSMSGPECPSTPASGPVWQTKVQVGDFVTNEVSPGRPLFSYFSRSVPMTADPILLADTSKIVRVKMSLFMKLDPLRPPAETELFSSAYMRNQNQGPTSSFVASVSGGTNYTFDAGLSSDPEGRTLVYDWYTAPANATSVPSSLPSCSATQPNFGTTGWACLGTSVVITKALSTASKVFLQVTDPGNIAAISAIPAGACASAVDPLRTPTNCGAIP
jgi:type II secretory pathway pseudopilin PulG